MMRRNECREHLSSPGSNSKNKDSLKTKIKVELSSKEHEKSKTTPRLAYVIALKWSFHD